MNGLKLKELIVSFKVWGTNVIICLVTVTILIQQ